MDTYTVKTVSAESQLFVNLHSYLHELFHLYDSHDSRYDVELGSMFLDTCNTAEAIEYTYEYQPVDDCPTGNPWLVQLTEIVHNLSSAQTVIDRRTVQVLQFVADKAYDYVVRESKAFQQQLQSDYHDFVCNVEETTTSDLAI